MSTVMDNLAALPGWAWLLLSPIALAPLLFWLRRLVFRSPEEVLIAREYAAWAEAVAPYRWVGEIERDVTGGDVDMTFEAPEGGRRQVMRMFGSSGSGSIQTYGGTSGIQLIYDLDHAREVGVLEATRPVRQSARLASFLDAPGEQALAALPGCAHPEATSSLIVDTGMEYAWRRTAALSQRRGVALIPDPVATFAHVMTLDARIMGRTEHDELDPQTLDAIARGGGEVASTLAARALLALHPGSSQAAALRDERLGADASPSDVATLAGCVFDEGVLARLGLSPPEHAAHVRRAIVRGDHATGPALARRALARYGVDTLLGDPDDLASLVADTDPTDPQDLPYEARRAVTARRERDAHLLAVFVIAAFSDSEDVDAFEAAYTRLLGHVDQDFVHRARFGEVIGDVEDWAPELVYSALRHASHDDVYARWGRRLEDLWDDALAARLEEVVAHESLGIAGLTAIVSGATRNDALGLLAPARVAKARVEEGWTTRSEERALEEALGALEARARELLAGSEGHLSLAEAGPAGGLSVSSRAGEGDVEVVGEDASS
jgi:hypothetical protein